MTESTGSEPALVATPVVEEITSTAESTPAVTDANVKPVPPPEEPVQKRIDKLTWQARQAERDRDYWRQQAQGQPPAKPEAAEPEKPLARPKLEQFNFDEVAYEEALDKYYDAKAESVVEAKLQKREDEKVQRERAKTWEKRETDFRSKTPDYEDVAYDQSVPINAIMAKLIRESDIGPEVAYFLGKNKEIAGGIHELDAVSAAREIGKIEARLATPVPPPAPAPAPKPVSKAPPPPPKIEATEPAITKSWNDPSLTQDEFNKRRRQVIAQRR